MQRMGGGGYQRQLQFRGCQAWVGEDTQGGSDAKEGWGGYQRLLLRRCRGGEMRVPEAEVVAAMPRMGGRGRIPEAVTMQRMGGGG
eukprot:2008897-Rhodomonas_salina.1